MLPLMPTGPLAALHQLPVPLVATQLRAGLQNTDVVVSPPAKEAAKLLNAFLHNVVHSGKEFVRWMDATCLEMPDQRPRSEGGGGRASSTGAGGNGGEPLVLHFKEDVVQLVGVG